MEYNKRKVSNVCVSMCSTYSLSQSVSHIHISRILGLWHAQWRQLSGDACRFIYILFLTILYSSVPTYSFHIFIYGFWAARCCCCRCFCYIFTVFISIVAFVANFAAAAAFTIVVWCVQCMCVSVLPVICFGFWITFWCCTQWWYVVHMVVTHSDTNCHIMKIAATY